MEIWPAIDMRGGKCVRLRQGDYAQETIYADRPADMARQWVAQGAKRLHLVDLDGARDGRSANLQAVREILAEVKVPCQLGGGIRGEETIAELLEIGVQRLIVGTKAIKEPDWFREICRKYPQRLALGIDARNGYVATDGWLETSSTSAVELANQFRDEPVAAIIYTDIAKDGMLQGPNFGAMEEMRRAVPIPVIASGGVTSIEDVGKLAASGIAGAILGRALYEGRLNLAEALAVSGEEEAG